MIRTFSLSGSGSHILSQSLSPPIQLKSSLGYSLGLIGFYTVNSIPNIEPGKNKFYYDKKVLEIPTGSYEIEKIQEYLEKQLVPKNSKKYIKIEVNNNTLETNFSSSFKVDFTKEDSIGSILGFSTTHPILEANKVYTSSETHILKVTTIRVECNITGGSYYNGRPSHTLLEFAPSVPPGFELDISPSKPDYLPVITDSIDNITITLLDQKGRPVNFRDEEIVIRLKLIENGFASEML